jgi:hypothetical protein
VRINDCVAPLISNSYPFLNSEGPSPRDDLESLAYTAVWLLKGTLPWEGYNRTATIQRLKSTMRGEVLAAVLPKAFGDFFDYARGLEYHEQPDYEYWKTTFLALSKESRYSLDSTLSLDTTTGGNDQIRWHGPRISESSNDTTDDEEEEDFEDDDFFLPKLDWPSPQGVNERDLLGDEQLILEKSHVIILTAPPTVFKGISDLYYPEAEKMIS